MSVISKATAIRGIKSGRYFVRQYGDDGTHYADLNRIPRTKVERIRAPTITDNDKHYLILDDCRNYTVDFVRVDW